MTPTSSNQGRTGRPLLLVISIGIVVMLLAGGGFWWFSQHATNPQGKNAGSQALTTLPGHTVPELLAGKDLGPITDTTAFTLAFVVAAQNQAALQQIADAVNDPNSPDYQHFPSADDLGTRFGVSQTKVQQLKQYLQESHVVTSDVQLTGQSIIVTTDAASITRGLHTVIHTYEVAGEQYVGPASDPQVPSSVAAFINHIDGLDTYPKQFNHTTVQPQSPGRPAVAGYSMQQLRHFYGADALTGMDGTGQTIALLEYSDFSDSDVQHYGIPQSQYQRIAVKAGPQASGANLKGAIEVSLDMEILYGIAPKAKQLVYIAPQSVSLDTFFNRIVADHKANIVSISWGSCEHRYLNNAGKHILDNINAAMLKGASQGMSFFTASGDNGAYGCFRSSFSHVLSVGVPADAPWATAVGGTSIVALDSPYIAGKSERSWSCFWLFCGAPTGSGGGVSTYFSVPSYQKNVKKPKDAANVGRYVPDIAANADGRTGYQIYCTVKASKCGSATSAQTNMVVGGTSGAAPLWAASFALIDQYLASKQKTTGNANQLIYTLASSSKQSAGFHDITAGDNLHYAATNGFDLATGWGSLDVAALAKAIATVKP